METYLLSVVRDQLRNPDICFMLNETITLHHCRGRDGGGASRRCSVCTPGSQEARAAQWHQTSGLREGEIRTSRRSPRITQCSGQNTTTWQIGKSDQTSEQESGYSFESAGGTLHLTTAFHVPLQMRTDHVHTRARKNTDQPLLRLSQVMTQGWR